MRAERRAQELASYDTLTRLANRRHFRDELDRHIATSRTNKRKMALLFVDLDRFKRINDTLGHAGGDELLATVAENMSARLRGSDMLARNATSMNTPTIARIGGDEFTILLTEVRRAEDASLVADRILEAVRRPVVASELEIPCTASIGIAVFPQDGEDADALIHSSDLAMYEAKKLGGDRACFFDQATADAVRRRTWIETELRRAIPSGDLTTHYQPIVDGRTGALIGAEALLRWQASNGEWIPPNEAVSVAQSCGLIRDLGREVWRLVTQQMAAWSAAGFEITVSVNVSPDELRDPTFAQEVIEVIDAAGVDRDRIRLEITETSIVDDTEETRSTLRAIADHGLKLVLDDFGTGYSSLSLLSTLPISAVKIDREFVWAICDSKPDSSIAEAIIAMSHALGLGVVAEGVESEMQARRLLAAGSNAFQGFRYSPAVPAGELAELASQKKWLGEADESLTGSE